MPQLAPTFSEVFDYQAYEENTVDESTVEVEKPDGPSFDVMDFPLDLPLDLPLHDVQNVASQDGALMQGPLRILHRLFHTDDQEIARTPSAVPLRRETTELMLDLSLPTAGPSRTASQQRLARELERMTSDFGSEFDGSDAVIYGGTERSEGSFSYQDCDEVEQSAHEDSCCSDVATQCDDYEDSLSDASQSEDEENVFDFEAQGSEDCDSDEVEGSEEDFASQSEEARSCDELSLAEDLPQDFPTPAPLEGVPSPSPSSLPSSFPSLFPSSSSFPSTSSSPPSSSLRRSSRVRRAAQPYVPPSSPKKDKGKGKAVAAEPRSPASSRRTIPKRGRSLSPVPEDTEDANAPSCSRSRKRARRSHSAVQALLAPLADGSTDVPCAVAGCDTVCSRNNLHALDNHFRDHYSSAERKRPAVRCRWGKCRTRGLFAELLRHLKKDHVEARFTCPDCGRSFSRIDPLTRHQRQSCKKRPDAGAEKNGKGKRK